MRLALLLPLPLLLACGPPPAAPPQPAPTPSAPAAPAPAPEPPKAQAPRPPTPRVPVFPADPRWGNDDAPVTVVLFAELAGEPTAAVARLLDKLDKRYGPSRLRVVWKPMPGAAPPPPPPPPPGLAASTPPRPLPPLRLAQAAVGVFAASGPGAFREWRRLLQETPASASSLEAVLKAAEQAGIRDRAAFERQLAGDAFEAAVQDNIDLASRLSIERVPTMFINGFKVAGVARLDALLPIVDDELAKVAELGSAGKPPAELYALRTQQNARNERQFPWVAPRPRDGDRARVSLGSSPALGSPRAPVTLVAFGGYQDPFSRRTQVTLRSLAARYKDELRIVWKNAPLNFHQNGVGLASLALEARAQRGDAGFWQAHERLMDNDFWTHLPPNVSLGQRFSPAGWNWVIGKLGLNLAKTRQAIDGSKHQQALDGDQAQAKALQVTGTPAFFINGQRLTGAQPEERFRVIIDEELARARQRISAGTPPERVYEATMESIAEE